MPVGNARSKILSKVIGRKSNKNHQAHVFTFHLHILFNIIYTEPLHFRDNYNEFVCQCLSFGGPLFNVYDRSNYID